jgi:hypothetical protein
MASRRDSASELLKKSIEIARNPGRRLMQAWAKYCGITKWVGAMGETWQAKSAFLQA